MLSTVSATVLSGVLTYVIGQIILKLVIEPVQETKKTIGQISHTLIERDNVIKNPGVPSEDIILDTSRQLRMLSSQLHAHIRLVPSYDWTASVFALPNKNKILSASKSLIGLSNSLYADGERVYESNAMRVENICDSLDIYLPDDERWSKV